jgi:signal transduction histidine kinase/streptogramin lyase
LAAPQAWTFGMTDEGRIWFDPRRPLSPAPVATDVVPYLDGLLTAALRDSRGRLWVGSLAGLRVQVAEHEPLVSVPLDHLGLGALTHEILDIVEDRVGAIWLGTFGGVLRFDPHRKAFTQIVHRPGDPQTLASNAVSAVYQEASGRLWVGTFGAGLDAIDAARGTIVHHLPRPGDATSLCNGYIWDLAPSRRGTLWVGANGGFCHLQDDRFRAFALPAPASNALSLRETVDGTLWIGTSDGLFRVPSGGHRAEPIVTDAELPQPIDSLHVAADGRLWLASAGSGDLAWYDPATGAHRSFRRVGSEGIWDLEWDSTGRLWLATGAGLASFDVESGTARNVPRPADQVPAVAYSIVADTRGRLWLGTSRGLVRYDPSTEDYRAYAVGDGPGHIEFNRHAAFRSASGELFFGGMSGVTRLAPEAIRDNPFRPPVVLTAVRASGEAGERRLGPRGLDRVALTPRDRTVSFEFAALNFTEGGRNRYVYRLDGFDRDWIAASADRTARYTSLPAGEYVFRVRASNNDGVWSDREVALAVSVLPPFWQTWWFRTVALTGIVGLLLATHRLRTAHLVGLERLRLRIASDLHDELGSELSGIALASGLVAQQPELTDRDRSRLTAVSASAHKVMDGLRDIIWCISPDHDTLESMEQRMRAVARVLLVDVSYEFHATGIRAAAVDMGPRRHLFLIYKELLHNIVRHARATSVRIALDASGDMLRLSVTDNGHGFTGGTADGSGLRNMRRRAHEIGADLAFDATPGGGTTASITVRMTRTRGSEGRRTTVL